MEANNAASRVMVGIVLITLFTIAIGLLLFAFDPAMQQPAQALRVEYDY